MMEERTRARMMVLYDFSLGVGEKKRYAGHVEHGLQGFKEGYLIDQALRVVMTCLHGPSRLDCEERTLW